MGHFLSTAPRKALTVLLMAQGSLFYGLSRGEPEVMVRPLSGFPSGIGGWRMVRETAMDEDVKATLRADDYLTRDYAGPQRRLVNLFVASFKSQRAGQAPHSPKNCLPGSGWVWSVSDVIPVSIAHRATPVEINRYIVSKGDEKAVVLYWYQSRDRVVAGEFQAAAFTAWDALRHNRTDTALVRVVVPVAGNQDGPATRAGVEFVQTIFSTLRSFFPL
ncbi:MAG TPA: EpsI family protein [Bryobacteraceae bacterium]|nr:EpsI family protein [Bryobacteraceae bacterium]